MKAEITVDALIENTNTVIAFLDDFLQPLNCSPKATMQLDIATEELFVNIAHYAYAPDHGKATIILEAQEDVPAVKVTFIDSGVPYDPLAKEDPDVTLSAEERQIGGLGIYMVKKSMDDITYSYSDGRNILSIYKKIG